MLSQLIIIKRLHLIRDFIILEEEAGIVSQTSKIKELELDDKVKDILILLENKNYSHAIAEIEIYTSKFNQLQHYVDSEIQGLKLEAKSLEVELKKLSDEKADIDKIIYEFSVRQRNELGEIIEKILNYNRAKAQGTPQEQEAEKEYKDYYDQYEINKDGMVLELSDEEKKELKRLYRKASKLCHPDVINEIQKEEAQKIFAELNSAYEQNDLKRVTEILANLEKGEFFISISDAVNEKQLLKSEVEKLRLRINELRTQIKALKLSEAYRTIISISNWDNYFSTTKESLEQHLASLGEKEKWEETN